LKINGFFRELNIGLSDDISDEGLLGKHLLSSLFYTSNLPKMWQVNLKCDM